MDKTKTLQKQKSFSFREMAVTRSTEKGTKFSPTKMLQDKEFILRALVDALITGDAQAFKEIVKAHYEALSIGDTLKRVHLSRRTYYEAISQKGNPTLQTISKIMQGMSENLWT